MFLLAFIGDPNKLEILYDRFLDPQKSPEELLLEIEEALNSGILTIEQIEELINNFEQGA